MGPIEHQKQLDERRDVETALSEAVRMNQAAIKQLEARSEELMERLTGAEKVIETSKAFGVKGKGDHQKDESKNARGGVSMGMGITPEGRGSNVASELHLFTMFEV